MTWRPLIGRTGAAQAPAPRCGLTTPGGSALAIRSGRATRPLRPASDLVKILELHLLAFGPFTDLRLDFSSPSPGLHVVYGPNEAGKSTALRAIRGLLYGIPHITPDAHVHHNTDLRVGGRLAGRGDAALALVRRKGRVKTLRDADDNPLDDAALAPVLGGVTEELFRTSFGLAHDTLRQGAEALLQGKGDVGQSLFGAGLGGPGLQQLLTTLRQEADEIFTPQARTRPLNEAIKAFEEARGKAKSAARPPQTGPASGRRSTRPGPSRSASTRSCAPSARPTSGSGARSACCRCSRRGARSSAGAPRSATSSCCPRPRSATARTRRTAPPTRGAQAERLRADIEGARGPRAALHVPASLAELDPGEIDGLVTRLGSHRKAAVDLPRVRAELHGLEEEARAILRRLGRDASLVEGDDPERLEAMRVDVATEARIKKLARERGAVEAKPREVGAAARGAQARGATPARAGWPSCRRARTPPRSAARSLGRRSRATSSSASARPPPSAARLAREADAQRDRLALGVAAGRTRLDVEDVGDVGGVAGSTAHRAAGRSPRPRRAPSPSRCPRRSTRRPRGGARSPGSRATRRARRRGRGAPARARARSTPSSAPAPCPPRPTSRGARAPGRRLQGRCCAPSRRRAAPAPPRRRSTPPRSSTSAPTRPPRPAPVGGAARCARC